MDNIENDDQSTAPICWMCTAKPYSPDARDCPVCFGSRHSSGSDYEDHKLMYEKRIEDALQGLCTNDADSVSPPSDKQEKAEQAFIEYEHHLDMLNLAHRELRQALLDINPTLGMIPVGKSCGDCRSFSLCAMYHGVNGYDSMCIRDKGGFSPYPEKS